MSDSVLRTVVVYSGAHLGIRRCKQNKLHGRQHSNEGAEGANALRFGASCLPSFLLNFRLSNSRHQENADAEGTPRTCTWLAVMVLAESRTADSAASLRRLARSAPTRPGTSCASCLRSTSSASLCFCACTCRRPGFFCTVGLLLIVAVPWFESINADSRSVGNYKTVQIAASACVLLRRLHD